MNVKKKIILQLKVGFWRRPIAITFLLKRTVNGRKEFLLINNDDKLLKNEPLKSKFTFFAHL